MTGRIQKWGNSLAIRIPRTVVQDAQLKPGSEVDLRLKNGRIVIVPAKQPRFRLADLVKQIRKSNLHGEISTGPAVGGEAW